MKRTIFDDSDALMKPRRHHQVGAATTPVPRSAVAKLRFEELEWRHRAARCPRCREIVLARRRHYFPQLTGLALVIAPFWLPLYVLAQLLPFSWRCAVCGHGQARSDLGSKEGAEFVEAVRNTERLAHEKAAADRGHRSPPPKFKRIGVYESLAEKGWFGDEPIINAGVQYNSLADAASRAAYRGMKPWLVQTFMIVATVTTFLVGFFINGWLSVGVGFAFAAWIAAYRGHRPRRQEPRRDAGTSRVSR